MVGHQYYDNISLKIKKINFMMLKSLSLCKKAVNWLISEVYTFKKK